MKKKNEYGIVKGGKAYKKIFSLRDVDGHICDIPEYEVARAITMILHDKIKLDIQDKKDKKGKKDKQQDTFAP